MRWRRMMASFVDPRRHDGRALQLTSAVQSPGIDRRIYVDDDDAFSLWIGATGKPDPGFEIPSPNFYVRPMIDWFVRKSPGWTGPPRPVLTPSLWFGHTSQDGVREMAVWLVFVSMPNSQDGEWCVGVVFCPWQCHRLKLVSKNVACFTGHTPTRVSGVAQEYFRAASHDLLGE